MREHSGHRSVLFRINRVIGSTPGGGHAWHHLSRRSDCGDSGDTFVLWPALKRRRCNQRTKSMTFSDIPSANPRLERSISYIDWGPVIAGAIAAAALAFVLHSFGGAIGLALSSTAPTWRDSSVALWVLSGLYLVLVALASYGLGGYVAGRARTALVSGTDEQIE